jgi:hypothetical protein
MAPKPMTKKIPAAAIHPFASATLTNISNWSGDESLSIADWRNGEAAVGEIGINRHFQDVPEKKLIVGATIRIKWSHASQFWRGVG